MLARADCLDGIDQLQRRRIFQYITRRSRIEASGEFPPDGLEYHVAFSSGGSFRVSEIWDSKEQFEAFGQRLMPILAENGIELAGPPEVIEVHNIVKR